MHIVIAGEEVKNREPLECPLPAESVALVERYLREFRPHLASTENTARELPEASRTRRFSETRSREQSAPRPDYGSILTCFATSPPSCISTPSPAPMKVRRVLAHRSIDTTTAFYTGLETSAAVRHFDQTLLDLRKISGIERFKRPKRIGPNGSGQGK
jgi:hypothetical protein